MGGMCQFALEKYGTSEIKGTNSEKKVFFAYKDLSINK